MERLTLAMTDRLVARGVATEEEQPIIRYGLEVMLPLWHTQITPSPHRSAGIIAAAM